MPRAFVALSRTNLRTLPPDYRNRITGAWDGPVELLYERRDERRLRGLARLVREAGRYDAIVLDGSVGLRGGYLDLLAAVLIRLRRRRPIVVIADATWEAGGALNRLAMRSGLRLVDDDRVTYTVASNDEVRIFPRTWGVDPERVAFVPWPYTLREEELREATERDGVFAGGDSLRDYAPLVEAARELPVQVTLATRRRDVIERTDLPANVDARPLSHDEYVARLRESPVVVVPLVPTTDRSAGETTYVNALAMGKLVVATECLGIRDYIEPHVTGLLVPPGDARALRDALAWATDPANAEQVEGIRRRARAVAQERFRPDEYLANLLRVARRARERTASHR